MEDLTLDCYFTPQDWATFGSSETGNLVIDVNDCSGMARVIYSKEKAVQLRDWLNRFLAGYE